MRSLRPFRVALVCSLVVLTAEPAWAFVSPRWNALHAARRSTIQGRWRVLTAKGAAPERDLDLLVTIDATTIQLRPSHAPAIVLRYRVVEQDDEMLSLKVRRDDGEERGLDVLVDASDQLTLYLTDDDGHDEEVLRLERAD